MGGAFLRVDGRKRCAKDTDYGGEPLIKRVTPLVRRLKTIPGLKRLR